MVTYWGISSGISSESPRKCFTRVNIEIKTVDAYIATSVDLSNVHLPPDGINFEITKMAILYFKAGIFLNAVSAGLTMKDYVERTAGFVLRQLAVNSALRAHGVSVSPLNFYRPSE